MIAEAQESMGDVADLLDTEESTIANMLPSAREVREVAARSIGDAPSIDVLLLTTRLVRGHTVVEIPGQ